MEVTRVNRKKNELHQKQSPKTAASYTSRSSVHPALAYQRVKYAPSNQIDSSDIAVLQRTIGNRAVGQLLQMKIDEQPTLQRQAAPCPDRPEKEEEMQPMLQRQVEEDEEEMQPMLQRQVEEDEEEMQPMLQRQVEEDEEEMQPMLQRQVGAEREQTSAETREEIPVGLRTGVESLSGLDMSDVSVHRNSSKPAAVGALAYTQGRDIYVAPGQEKHLPHEAWHAVQQKQGRVHPNSSAQAAGIALNDDAHLEKEADRMGKMALQKTPTRTNTRRQTAHNDSIQKVEKKCPTNKTWRYGLPTSVKRTIIEVQAVVGETPDGAYGPKTCEAVKKYQKKLTAMGLYTDNIDGKWGPNTDAAHVQFATGNFAETYNCAGLAFKTYQYHGMTDTKSKLSAMTAKANCSQKCNPFQYKFWFWEYDVSLTHIPTSTTGPSQPDFHIVGGKTDSKGTGPSQVVSKNGKRPVKGPKPPASWYPTSAPARMNSHTDTIVPDYFKNRTNVKEKCYCSDSLP